MTVATTPRQAGPFTGTGADAALPFAFKCFDATEIMVTRAATLLTYGGDYTVTLNADQGATPGGTVNILAAANTIGASVAIKGNTPAKQPTSLPSQTRWSPKVVEAALDRLAMILQEQRLLIDGGESSLRLDLASSSGWNLIGAGGIAAMAAASILSSPTSTLFARPSINVSDGTLLKSATPDFLTLKPLEIAASTILLEPSEKVQINPTPLSYALGFGIVQSTPLSGSQAGPFFANTIDFTARSTLTGTGLPGGAASATFGGFRVSVNAGGANFGCVSVMGGSVGVTQTVADTSTGDKNGFSSGVSISASTPGKLYGSSSAWSVLSGGVCPAAVGHETDVTISGTGSVDHAIGFNAWKGGTGSGAINDAAYAIGISGAVGAAKWKVGHLLYTQSGVTASPVDASTNLFASDHTTTIGSLIYYPNVTVTNYIIETPNVRLTGGGDFFWKPGASVSPAANGQMTVQATSNTSLTFKLKGSDGTVRSGSITLT